MTGTPKDGGQAYPAAWGNPEQGGDYVPGMSLRDWFAGQALVGLMSQPGEHWGLQDIVDAYQIADAMLKEREASE